MINTLNSLANDWELTSQILSYIPDLVVFQDTQVRFLCANAAAVTALGFDNSSQMIGLYPKDVRCLAAEIHDQVVANAQDVMERNCIVTTLFSTYLSNNQWQLHVARQQPLRDQTGTIIGLSSMAMEVTHTSITNHLLFLFLEKKGKGNTKLRQGVYKYLDSRQEWNLSIRQGECFFWLLQRKTAKEISTLLGLSKRTIEYYISLIKAKFNVKTVNELIDMAHEKGLFNYIPEHWYKLDNSP